MNVTDFCSYNQWLLNVLIVLGCVVVMVGCICRVNLLDSRNALGWVLAYVLMAGLAMRLLLNALHQANTSWYAVLGVLAALMHLFSTQRVWKDDAPPFTQRNFMLEKG